MIASALLYRGVCARSSMALRRARASSPAVSTAILSRSRLDRAGAEFRSPPEMISRDIGGAIVVSCRSGCEPAARVPGSGGHEAFTWRAAPAER